MPSICTIDPAGSSAGSAATCPGSTATPDVVVPRIGASITAYGLAVVNQFEMMNVGIVNRSQAIARARDKLRADDPAGASAVVDHDVLAQALGEFLRHGARHDVARAGRRRRLRAYRREALDHALGAGKLGTLKVAFDPRAEAI